MTTNPRTQEVLSVQQVSRPQGRATPEDFAFVRTPLPTPSAGTALVENVLFSVDPYMRELMDEGGWELNSPLEGRTVGRVLNSADPRLTEGDLVFHRAGWRTHALVDAAEVRVLPAPLEVPLSAYLGILGGTGLSAYVGLTRIARIQPGDTVFISAAAGGVGSAAGRFARLLGAERIIGSTGSAAKAEYLVKQLGFDAAFDYHDGPVSAQLAQAAPDGIDVCFENVGGEHLEGAIGALREYGRIAWCGAVAQVNTAGAPAAPRNLYDIVEKNIRLEGFLVRNYRDVQSELEEFAIPHLRDGRLSSDETIVEGFERIVDAFLSMLSGGNTGKMIVRAANP